MMMTSWSNMMMTSWCSRTGTTLGLVKRLQSPGTSLSPDDDVWHIHEHWRWCSWSEDWHETEERSCVSRRLCGRPSHDQVIHISRFETNDSQETGSTGSVIWWQVGKKVFYGGWNIHVRRQMFPHCRQNVLLGCFYSGWRRELPVKRFVYYESINREIHRKLIYTKN